MVFQVAVSDAIKRRLDLYGDDRYLAFNKAVADVVKGRVRGKKLHTSAFNQREMYAYKEGPYTLYYSVDPQLGAPSLVIEEYLSDAEGELIMDTFGEGRD
jgi:hypothetical protein